MSRQKQLLNQLFKRFIRNHANEEDQSIFWHWIWHLNIHKQPVFKDKEQEDLVRDRMLQAIFLQIAAPGTTGYKRKLAAVRSIAAVLIIAVAGTTGWLLLNHGSHQPKSVSMVISNGGASIRSILLPDSTSVTLNLYSSLEYPANYDQHERRVIVKGEAYFDVHKDDKHPFIVQAGNIETKALGTAFDIETYPAESEIRVSLMNGSVLVSHQQNEFHASILKPEEQLRYDRQNRRIRIERHESANTVTWMQGGLGFAGMPLSEALERISRRFHISIRYNGDQLKGKTVTGTFPRSGWEDILRNILFPHNLNFSNKGDTVFIHHR